MSIAAQARGEGSCIAICEDERIIALDIQSFLTRNGYRVFGIYEAAEDLFSAMDGREPDLVLMDIHLQGRMDGLEAAAILNERHGIPVIVLTAYADAATIERAKLSQPFGYVLKPYDDRELRTAIEIGAYRSVMEKRLKASEARFRRLFEQSLAALFLVDESGRILESNPAFAAMGGEGKTLESVFKNPELAKDVLGRLASGDVVVTESMPLAPGPLGGPGGERWAMVSADRVAVPGDASAYLFQAFDITERRRLQESLAEAQKMEALGRLAGGVAHDFNNVITAIGGYTRLARDGLGQNSEVLSELDGIEAAAKRASNLARQLLTFSRGDRADPTRFPLGQMVAEMARMLERLMGDACSLSISGPEGDDGVLADRGRMEQVLLNLVVNARDAMPSGGTVWVRTGRRRLDQAEATALGAMPTGDWSFFSVRDGGTGIQPEILSRIFEPFFSTKEPGKGTGLGLATSVGMVRQAGGYISVATALGSGSTFTVYLPYAKSD